MSTKRHASDSESEIDVKPTAPTTTPKKAKASTSPTVSPKRPDPWTPERRLKLFDAFVKVADVKWDEVAAAVSAFVLYQRGLTGSLTMGLLARCVASSGSALRARRYERHSRVSEHSTSRWAALARK